MFTMKIVKIVPFPSFTFIKVDEWEYMMRKD